MRPPKYFIMLNPCLLPGRLTYMHAGISQDVPTAETLEFLPKSKFPKPGDSGLHGGLQTSTTFVCWQTQVQTENIIYKHLLSFLPAFPIYCTGPAYIPFVEGCLFFQSVSYFWLNKSIMGIKLLLIYKIALLFCCLLSILALSILQSIKKSVCRVRNNYFLK